MKDILVSVGVSRIVKVPAHINSFNDYVEFLDDKNLWPNMDDKEEVSIQILSDDAYIKEQEEEGNGDR